MSKQKFKTKLRKMGSWTIAITPIDVRKIFGTGGHVRVKGTVDGVAFSGISLMPMKNKKHCLAIKAELRKAIGKEAGVTVEFILERDTAELKIPKELKEAFEASPEAKKLFDSYSYSHKKMYSGYIDEAKKQEVRDKRAVDAVLKLEKIYIEKFNRRER